MIKSPECEIVNVKDSNQHIDRDSLSPSQIYEFLDLGYLELKLNEPTLNGDFADRMFAAARNAYAQNEQRNDSQNPVKYIADDRLDTIPAVDVLLNSRELNGALTSLLGEKYFRYRHSFVHRSGLGDQSFHKDSPLPWGGKGGIRSHKLEWVMVFYYPQKTTVELGPTEVLPGTQYWNVDREHTDNTRGEDRLGLDFERQGAGTSPDLALRDRLIAEQWQTLDRGITPKRLIADPGSLFLIHFDLFHRGTRLESEGERYMFKFWYTRTVEPNHSKSFAPIHYRPMDSRRFPVVQYVGSWMGLPKLLDGDEGSKETSAGAEELGEAERVASAYGQGTRGDRRLVEQICSGNEALRRAAQYGLIANPKLGLEAAKTLIESENPQDRTCAMFLLGELSDISDIEIQFIVESTRNDSDEAVSRAGLIALGKIKRRQSEAVSESVNDELLNVLLDLLDSVDSTDTQRQLAYLSLLVFAQSRLNPLTASSVDRIRRLVDGESNRYARETGQEVLKRVRLV